MKKGKKREPVGYTIEGVVFNAGGYKALAEALKIQRGSMYGWKYIPKRHVLVISSMTNIPLEKLRPDLSEVATYA